MRYGLGQNGGATRVEPETRIPTATGTGIREIPYDYVATFKLNGVRGHRIQDVISISTEGSFVAVAIGYSFQPDFAAVGTPTASGTPVVAGLLASMFPSGTAADQVLRAVAHGFLARHAGFHFRYSIVDSGSGRELQNQAIHNIAGLGSPDGERPFRPFARPALFMPRSTIRIEVEEVSEGPLFANGTLFVVLHGYKRLGE